MIGWRESGETRADAHTLCRGEMKYDGEGGSIKWVSETMATTRGKKIFGLYKMGNICPAAGPFPISKKSFCVWYTKGGSRGNQKLRAQAPPSTRGKRKMSMLVEWSIAKEMCVFRRLSDSSLALQEIEAAATWDMSLNAVLKGFPFRTAAAAACNVCWISDLVWPFSTSLGGYITQLYWNIQGGEGSKVFENLIFFLAVQKVISDSAAVGAPYMPACQFVSVACRLDYKKRGCNWIVKKKNK